MLKPERYKVGKKFGWDFSPGQHVWAICLFLVQALVMFMLGVAVGKYQPSSFYAQEKSATFFGDKDAQGAESNDRALSGLLKKNGGPGSGPRVAELPAPKSTERPAVVVSPGVTAPVNAPANVNASVSKAAVGTPPVSTPPVGTPPVSTPPANIPAEKAVPVGDDARALTENVPPAGAPAAGSSIGNAPVATVDAPVVAVGEVKVVEAAPVEKSAADRGAAESSGAKVDAAKAGKPVDKSATTAAAKPGTGKYVIQVASFSGKDKRRNAEVCKTRLERNAGMKAEILGTDADEYLRVVVGDYADKDSARKACGELRQRRDFSQCFVRQR